MAITNRVISPSEIAQSIDHTLLKPTLNLVELETLCIEAAEWNFKTVCVPPTCVKSAVQFLKGKNPKVITVVGFPLGYHSTESKVAEVKSALADGASEIDMVINLHFLKSKQLLAFERDIEAVSKTCGSIPLKVIIETAYLNESEKKEAALLAEKAGAHYIKTSTGFATGVPVTGATTEDIKLLREILNPQTKIKASGGIKNLTQARELILAGADRLGTSSGVSMLKGLEHKDSY